MSDRSSEAAPRFTCRAPWALAILVLMCVSALSGCQPKPWAGFSSDEKPNVLIFTLCSTRMDRLSVYGYTRPTTPTLESLAARGVRFSNAYANANWTVPAHATMLTGLYPSAHGVVHTDAKLSSSIAILPEIVTHYGYKTAVHAATPSPISFGPSQQLWRGFQQSSSPKSKDSAWDPSEFVGWLTSDDSPFFAVVHLRHAHYPYTDGLPYTEATDPRVSTWMNASYGLSRSEADRTFAQQLQTDPNLRANFDALYDAGVRRVDQSVADVLKVLEATGADKNTIIIAISGHGEALGEEGAFVHEHVLADEVLRVPWVMQLPGWNARHTVFDDVVSQVDLLPTVLDLLQLPAPGVLDGRSLVPLLRGESLEAVPALSQTADFKRGSDKNNRIWREVVNTDTHRYEPNPIVKPENPKGPALFRRGATLERVASPTPEEQAEVLKWHALIGDNQPIDQSRPKSLTTEQKQLRAAQGYW